MPLDFMAWPSIARLNRDMVVTEKIDGTNAAVIIESHGAHHVDHAKEYMVHADEQGDGYSTFRSRPAMLVGIDPASDSTETTVMEWPNMVEVFEIGAQSRKRLIKPGDDNFAFAKWVFENADGLLDALGAGRHFGEWWGSGIQRGYGLPKGEKRFSLFNVKRYRDVDFKTFGLENVETVPVLFEGPFSHEQIQFEVNYLRMFGSSLVEDDTSSAEGVVVYHVAANQLFKVTCENDEKPKSLVNAEAVR